PQGGATNGTPVLHVGWVAGPRHGRPPLARRRGGGAEIILIGVGADVAPGPIAGPVEQNEFRIEDLQHDLGRVFVLARLILPFARLQRTLEATCTAAIDRSFFSSPAWMMP